ncbi:MAG: HAD family phosphatase [Lachnospiraceae bacterium]|nr:HAD family phosphatase [Lachnospiraceae bacterium]
MKKTAIRMIAFDMDGTVLHNGAEITLRLQSILKKALEQGIYVVPCTGRGRMQLPATLAALDLPYTITSNGGRLRDEKRGESIYTNLVDWEMAAGICHDITELENFMCVHVDGHVHFQGAEEAFIRTKFSIPEYMPVDLTDSTEALLRETHGGAEKIFVRPATEEIRQQIRQRIMDKYDVYCSSSSAHNLEFGMPDCSKAAALQWLCQRLGVESGQVVAFGDGENDKEMLEFAGLGAAMGNAHPACQAAADVVIGTCAEDGVAVYLEQLLAD